MPKYTENGVEYEAVVLSQADGFAELAVRRDEGWKTVSRCQAGANGVYEQVVVTIRHAPPEPGEEVIGNVERERQNWGDKGKAETLG